MTKKKKELAPKKPSRYAAIISEIFRRHHRPGSTEFEFTRDELEKVAADNNIEDPKNHGDNLYSFRFRVKLPSEIRETAPEGKQWIIALAGRSRYRFKLVTAGNIIPRADLVTIKIPDATPEIIATYALRDEQALLCAKVRYNRLIDIFLGITAYSLQNHLRTTVEGMGQIEIDEIYVGVNRSGQQFVIPVQAKGGSDKLGVTQTMQDLACCAQKFPQLTCRPISAQFMANDVIALFELTAEGDAVKVVEERHYKLVPYDQIAAEELKAYAKR